MISTVSIQRAGVWPFCRWIVRENTSWGDLTEQAFASKEAALSHALDLADGDNRRVTLNGRPLDDV